MNDLDYRVLSFKNRTNKSGLLAWLQNEKDDKLLSITIPDKSCKEAILDQHCIKTSKDAVQNLIEKQLIARDKRLLHQHKATWQWVWSQLTSSEESISSELSNLLHKWQGNETELAELNDLDQSLRIETSNFWENVVQPMYILYDDLAFWIEAYNEQKDLGQGDSKAVFEIIKSVDEQQADILIALNSELKELGTNNTAYLSEKEINTEQLQGIPESVYLKSCPEELYTSLSEEFLILDIKYQHQLRTVNERHSTVICNPLENWNDDDHAIFLYAKQLYNEVGENSQELFYDILLRLLPHYSIEQLMSHNKWIKQNNQYRNAVAAVISSWKRTKEELRIKSEKLIMATQDVIKKEAENSIAYIKQKSACDMLYKKVVAWRQNKLRDLLQKEEEEKLRAAQEKLLSHKEETKRRKKLKKKLAYYNQMLEMSKEQKIQALKLKLEEEQLKKKLEAKHNAERVQFRNEQRRNKEEQLRQNFILMELKNKERELRLEKLRSKVAVEVPRDILRVFKTTTSVDAKRKPTFPANEEVPILKPLFEIYSFTDQQIAADRRIRLEQKFREAGVLHLSYAQEILKKIPPPTTPRPDMNSSFKFSEK